MIERTVPIDGATVEVTFKYEGPDWSAGITAGGWDTEATGACIKAGPVWTFVAFEPDDDSVPEMWRVREVQVNYAWATDSGQRVLTHMALSEYEGDDRLRLGDFAVICDAVKATWEQVQALDAIERAKEDVWSAEEMLHEIDAQLADTGDGHHRRAACRHIAETAKGRVGSLEIDYYAKYGAAPENPRAR